MLGQPGLRDRERRKWRIGGGRVRKKREGPASRAVANDCGTKGLPKCSVANSGLHGASVCTTSFASQRPQEVPTAVSSLCLCCSVVSAPSQGSEAEGRVQCFGTVSACELEGGRSQETLAII